MIRIKKTGRTFSCLLFAAVLFSIREAGGSDQVHRTSLSVRDEIERSRDRQTSVVQKKMATVTTSIAEEKELCTLEIEVENSGDQSDSCQLEWYFISKKTLGNGDDELTVFDAGKASVTLQGRESIEKKVTSKPFIFTVKDVESLGLGSGNATSMPKQTRGGDAYAGYIVLIREGGEIIEQESNSSRFLKEEWLERCAAFVPEKPAPKKKK